MLTGTKIRLVLTLTALLPGVASAEEMWRWRDASGGLHYSNIRAHAPGNAERVEGRIGELRGIEQAPAAKKGEASFGSHPGLLQERPAPAMQAAGCGPYGYFCPKLAIPWILTVNGHELADQVQEAALLDALHVPWRNGLCQ